MEALIALLIPLLMSIESNNNPNAIGDNGKAVGVLQIHKIFVRDVNRILGKDKYTYEDRYSVKKSKEMASVYLKRYCTKRVRGLSRMDALVLMGRCFNGGPSGYKKKATIKYGKKVRKAYLNL